MRGLERRRVEFQGLLLAWFSASGREFPWRRTRDPYKILLAEMLLQKTDSSKVLPVYREFAREYPTVESLANARLPSIKRLIRPLGLHYRANRLRLMARAIVSGHGGRVPTTAPELRRLPGIGPYMANAVLAVAFNQPVPIVDTNVVRIMRRVFGMRSSKARERTDGAFWSRVALTVPEDRGRNYDLALLDLGALICTARNPRCCECPVQHACGYYARIMRAPAIRRSRRSNRCRAS